MLATAHAIFEDEDARVIKRKNGLVMRGMTLWDAHAKTYQELPDKYAFLVGLRPRNPSNHKKCWPKLISKSVLEDYPKLRLLEFEDKAEARHWLMGMSISTLENLLERTEYALSTNYTYRTMNEWVKEATYLSKAS